MMLDLKKLFPNSKFPTAEELKAKEDTFSIGDKVKVADNIRCRQKGQTGTIVRIDPEDKHGWKSFIVKFDDETYGAMGFNSGSIDKINEKETVMKTINESTKVTLTIDQLRRLVSEAVEQDASEDDIERGHSYNSQSLKKAMTTRFLNLFGNLTHFNGGYVEKVHPRDERNGVEVDGCWRELAALTKKYQTERGPNWNVDAAYVYAYDDHISLQINMYHTYYNPYQQTDRQYFRFKFPYRRAKISVETEGSQTYTTVTMTSSDVYRYEYSSWKPVKGREAITLKFNGDALAKVSKKDLKAQNFGIELKSIIMKSVEKELDVDAWDASYSFNPETRSMTIKCSGSGKAYGDGYDYSGDCKLKYWGGNWKVISTYDEDGGKYDRNICNTALRICNNMMPVFQNNGKKLPKEVSIRLYVEYD